MEEGFKTGIERRGESTVLGLAGELDIATVPSFEAAVKEALGSPSAPKLVIDMLDVTFLDSSGLGALVSLRQSHPELDIVLVVGGGIVRKAIDTTGLTEWFRLVDSVEEAERARGA